MGKMFWFRAISPFMLIPFIVWVFNNDIIEHYRNPALWVLCIGVGIALLTAIAPMTVSAFTYFQTIEINEQGMLTGKNSFGRPLAPFDPSDVVDMHKDKKLRGIYFTLKNGRKVHIWGAIDYAGFIYDYIIWKADIKKVYEYKWAKKEYVENENFWRYEPEEKISGRIYAEGYKESMEEFISMTKAKMNKV